MASIPSETIEQIAAANDIVEVIGAVLPLKRAGASFVALCPFHKEKTPSFHVNPQRQIFYCFGCHKGGSVFKFVQEYEAIGFVEAVRRLAERASIPLESTPDILVSLDNLKTFSWIRERVEQGELALHGWYFDIERGELLGYDATTRRFELLQP